MEDSQYQWIVDAHGMEWGRDAYDNTASVEYYGSRAEAAQALASLVACQNCQNRQNCNDCNNCQSCNNCQGCWGCQDCQDCQDCEDCEDCQGCQGCQSCLCCQGCQNCFGCQGCQSCQSCWVCQNCFGCQNCQNCQDCLGRENRSEHGSMAPLSIPVLPQIHQQVYAVASQPGALDMMMWHTCATRHCRAGWVIALAGEAGQALEALFNTSMAALMIYKANSPLRVALTRFYDTNTMALADMQRLAEEEVRLEQEPTPAQP